MQKKILVLSDLHVGSSYGLLPPSFMDGAGNLHEQNEGQKYLWGRFQHMLGRVSPQPIDAIVINGDILDGAQWKSKGAPLTLHRLEDQREAAVKVLEEVKNALPNAEWHFVEGTPYHEVGEEVRQVAFLLTEEKHDVHRTLTLRVGNAVIRFHHEVGFSGGFIKSGNLERELVTGSLAEAMQGWAKADAEIRSHCHYFCYVGRSNKLALVTPCWQLQTDYITKGSPTKNIPDIGAVVLSVDDALIEYGICPVNFTEYLYRHPQPEIQEMAEEDAAEVPELAVL